MDELGGRSWAHRAGVLHGALAWQQLDSNQCPVHSPRSHRNNLLPTFLHPIFFYFFYISSPAAVTTCSFHVPTAQCNCIQSRGCLLMCAHMDCFNISGFSYLNTVLLSLELYLVFPSSPKHHALGWQAVSPAGTHRALSLGIIIYADVRSGATVTGRPYLEKLEDLNHNDIIGDIRRATSSAGYKESKPKKNNHLFAPNQLLTAKEATKVGKPRFHGWGIWSTS